MMIRAALPDQMRQVHQLFVEYAESLSFSLCFQGFQKELDELPGRYGPPDGALLLAWEEGEAAGVVALRRHDELSAEMKRLYVRPQYRGKQIGRELAQAVILEAKRLGYHSIKLDTAPEMKAARQLYEELGFNEVPSYYDNHKRQTICMEKRITPG